MAKGFLEGYPTYDTEQGFGSPKQWKEAFNVRMGINEAKAILGRESPHSILGLVGNVAWNMQEIKKAYRRQARAWHPDRPHNKNKQTESKAMWLKIQAAYVKLGGS